MISASRYVAESRNAFPENSTLAAASNTKEETLLLNVSEGVEIKNVNTVLIFCDETSAIVGNVIDRRKPPAAVITGKHIYSKLYHDKTGSLIIEMCGDVPEYLLLQWMKIIIKQ